MFLDRIIIENVGPIDRLDIKLPFNENGNPKPIIFVGENGKGKSTVLSSIVDALFEFGKQSYDDIVETNKDGTKPYFKVLSKKNVKIGCEYSLSFINFKNKEKTLQYVEKVGKLSLEDCLQKTDRLLELSNSWNEQINIKKVSQDEDYFRDEFLNKSFCFFPPNRYERPHWMNDSMNIERGINIKPGIYGKLDKPIIVQDVTESNIKWLLDIIVDSRADLIQNTSGGWNMQQNPNDINLLKIARDNTETILSEILKKDVRFGLNFRNTRGSRFNVIDKKNNITILPTLDSLSTGESALFNMFSTIIRYSDYGDINKSIKLDEIEGIVIIDEIDLHLHSIVQREILPKLISKFPKVQFIITSHSPLFILGMEELFREDGFNIYEMPKGDIITPEEFSEFENSYQYYKKTNIFKNDVQDILKEQNGKPIIVTEGKTDWKHMKYALEKFKEQGLYTNLDIEFLEYENEIEMGYNNLISFCKARSNLKNLNKVICVFDRDLNDRDLKKVKDENTDYKLWDNGVVSLVLPVPDNRVDIEKIMCIEHYYSDEDIKITYKNRRLYLGDEFDYDYGVHIEEDKICKDKNKCGKKFIIDSGCKVAKLENREVNIALSKNDFANSILNREPEFININIDNFKLLFDLIESRIND